MERLLSSVHSGRVPGTVRNHFCRDLQQCSTTDPSSSKPWIQGLLSPWTAYTGETVGGVEQIQSWTAQHSSCNRRRISWIGHS